MPQVMFRKYPPRSKVFAVMGGDIGGGMDSDTLRLFERMDDAIRYSKELVAGTWQCGICPRYEYAEIVERIIR